MVTKSLELVKNVAQETGLDPQIVRVVMDSFLRQILIALYQDTEHKVLLQNFMVMEWRQQTDGDGKSAQYEDRRLEADFASNLKRTVARIGMERVLEVY